MGSSLLERIFARHYRDPQAALSRFRLEIAAASVEFPIEDAVFELPQSKNPGLPANLPPAVYYFIGGTGFGSIKKLPTGDDPATHLRTSDGVGLNMGCPIRLARALNVLFSLSLEDRREPLLQLRTRTGHLAAVEEVLWLTLWHRQYGVTRGGELVKRGNGEKGKDIDWFFWSDSLPIYLETKFRQMDWMRLTDSDRGQIQRSFFDDIGAKFPTEESRFQNCVAAITGFAEPDDSFFALCERKLLSTPGLNAVLFRTFLGPITICSLNPCTVSKLAARVHEPYFGDYPPYYQITWNRVLRERRGGTKPRKRIPERGRLYVAHVPGPMPRFTPQYPPRFNVAKWGPTGQPSFDEVPAFHSAAAPDK